MPSSTRVFVYEYLSGGGAGASPTAFTELLEAGRSMRDAVAEDFAALDGVAVTRAISAFERHAPGASRVFDIAPHEGESATAFVAREARAHDLVVVIAPETDGILATLRHAVGDGRWLGCSAQAIALASSKTATRRRLAAYRIQTPTAWEPGQPPLPDAAGWVVKPDDGAGCLDTVWFERFDAARAELLDRLRQGRLATMESWVPGAASSLSLMCHAGRATLLSINHQSIRVEASHELRYAGVSIAASSLDDARGIALAELARGIARALPRLDGFVGIDLVEHPVRGPVVIEVNPRITCAYVGLSAALGRNLARDMLRPTRAYRHHVAA